MNATEEYIKAVEVLSHMHKVIEEFRLECCKDGYTCTEEAWEILCLVQELALSVLNMEETSEQ